MYTLQQSLGMHWPRGQKVKVTWLRECHGRTVASDPDRYFVYPYAAVLPVAIAGVGLHINTIAYVF